jgi:PAS domain S-box-containing protein
MDALISAGATALLDAVGDGIAIQDTTGRIVYANPAAARIIGFNSPAELLETPTSEILRRFEVLDEDGAPFPPERLPGRAVLAGEPAGQRVLQFRARGSPELRWSVIKAEPVYNPDGSIRLVVNIWHDITERMERQRALEEATTQLEETTVELEATISELEVRTDEAETRAERHKFLAEAGRMLASSFDAEETLRMVVHLAVPSIANWAEVRLLREDGELQRLEIAHADPEKLIAAIQLEERFPADPATSPTYEVVRTGMPRIFREVPASLVRKTARSEEHYRLLSALELDSALIVPIKVRDATLGTILLARSRQQRAFDDEDLEFAESFAARAGLALTNARLYGEAQEANRTKADFLAVMSHELRTPLTAIFGYTELLATGVAGAMTDTQRAHLDRIHGSASQLLTIIEDILAYARTEAGRDEVHADIFRLSEVISEALMVVRPNAEKKELLLEANIAEDAPLHTDRAKLRQIVINLLGNAIKFTDHGSVRVRATAADGECRITVEDTGVGIDPAYLDRIFEPFRQLEPSMTRRAGGTGLGLAVSRRFAALLGGTITVDSTPGQGSRFTVVLPLSGTP